MAGSQPCKNTYLLLSILLFLAVSKAQPLDIDFSSPEFQRDTASPTPEPSPVSPTPKPSPGIFAEGPSTKKLGPTQRFSHAPSHSISHPSPAPNGPSSPSSGMHNAPGPGSKTESAPGPGPDTTLHHLAPAPASADAFPPDFKSGPYPAHAPSSAYAFPGPAPDTSPQPSLSPAPDDSRQAAAPVPVPSIPPTSPPTAIASPLLSSSQLQPPPSSSPSLLQSNNEIDGGKGPASKKDSGVGVSGAFAIAIGIAAGLAFLAVLGFVIVQRRRNMRRGYHTTWNRSAMEESFAL